MQVWIRHREKTRGLLRPIRQIEVSVSVQFSEVEQFVIRQRQLEDFIVLKREPDRLTVRRRAFFTKRSKDGFDLLVADLSRHRSNRFLCDTPAHAKAYEHALADGLQKLKLFISDNESVGANRTLEF